MITIFSCPKPFTNPHINIIQRNAIQSWISLHSNIEVILLGDDDGVEDIAREYNIKHIPNVEKNEFGTPLLNSIFMKAESIAKFQIMCYVNADIILLENFVDAIRIVSEKFWKFLIVSRRWDVNIKNLIDFSDKKYEMDLKEYVRVHGKLHPPTGIDVFVYPKGLYMKIPQFALGRGAFDNWIIYYAYSNGVPIIDITDFTMIIHQNHDYSHYPGGLSELLKGPEIKQNLKLAGGWKHIYTINDAGYILTKDGGLKNAPFYRHLLERLRYLTIVPLRKSLKQILKHQL
ncbi:MAG: hypothetical protein QW738_08420 [Nitrososphaeria archaeon]